MEINQKIKEDLEGRIRKLEDFIESKGIGSARLSKAKKMQRNFNLVVFVGSLITVTGLAFWALSRNNED